MHLYFFHGATAASGPEPPHHPVFTITLRHTALSRILLNEWSAWRLHFYLIAHNTLRRHTFKSSAVGFETTVPKSERP